MGDSTYNGWTNYETWAVGMFLDGNYDGEGAYRHVLEIAREGACEGIYAVASVLEEFVSESLPELDGIAADLLGAATSEVNWHELATSKYNEIVEEWTSEAREEGKRAGRAAGSWAADGNTSITHAAMVLALIADGDPEAENYLPKYPNLSGEFADDPTPASLAEEITGCDELDSELIDALAEAWEAGVAETFEDACVTELRARVGRES